MVTKKQHYYPRALLRYFADENEKFYAYNSQRKTVEYTYYEKVCFQNYTYETIKIDGVVDNILENELSNYESKIGGVLKYIFSQTKPEKLILSAEQVNIIWQYMWLQYLRTDSGRITFIDGIDNNFSKPRQYPMELDEIKLKKEKILRFNSMFKEPRNLKMLLSGPKPAGMYFHILVGNGFLTSDNPVIATYGKSDKNSGFQLIMPICPYFVFTFQSGDLNCSENLIVQTTDDKLRYVNEAIINTANYFIISSKPFDFIQESYIYNRFNNKNWLENSRHFKEDD